MEEFDMLSFQKETNEKINTFIMDIRIDLIKKISSKYKLDEKSVLRDFINNNWKNDESSSKKKNDLDVEQKTTLKEAEPIQCYAKVFGNKRCSRNCKGYKNYCGTHLKQLKDYGKLKNGSFPIENLSESEVEEEEDIFDSEAEEEEDQEDQDTNSDSSGEELELNLVELISGLKVYVDLKTNDVYDINEDSNELIGKLSSIENEEEDDIEQFIIYNEEFLGRCKINKKNNEIYKDKQFIGILQKNGSIVYDINFIKLNNKKF